MKVLKYFAAGTLAFVILYYFVMPEPEIHEDMKNADLPWNIKVYEDGSSEVFRLHLLHSTLQDAINRFHEPEDLAIYLGEESHSLEAYFGTVHIGLLAAKLVITLDSGPDGLQEMLSRAPGRSLSASDDAKIRVSTEDKQKALLKKITAITFIPKYSGLEADYFKQRFGEPQSWLRLSENAVQYFYPDKGLSITIDAEGKEILQYGAPATFKVPEQANINSD